jgi:hypothetical protein
MTFKEQFIEFLETVFENDVSGEGYIGVQMITPTTVIEPELIINPVNNMKLKLEYYKNSYNNNLELNNNPHVRITDYQWSSTVEDLVKLYLLEEI